MGLQKCMSFTQRIKKKASDVGFDLVGVAPVEPVPELSFYRDWIEAGYAGKMAYLERQAEQKQSVKNIVPEAQSVIVCAKIYHTPFPLSVESDDTNRGWISRYAWGDDYHDILQKKLFEIIEFIRTEGPEEIVTRSYVDTGPVIDRVYAKYAGIGWFGKNTCIIDQQHGSWFFLGEIITNLKLDYDDPVPDRCGSCNRCIEACPTDALLEPYLLDSNRCISYLTIELHDEIPESLRKEMGNHLFGCDICQDVCPWNRKAPVTHEPAFQPRENFVNPYLSELAQFSVETFRQTFKNSPVKRSKYTGFMRNVAVAMGNSRNDAYLPILQELAEYEDPLIAVHAEWAITQIMAQNSAKGTKHSFKNGSMEPCQKTS